MTNAPKPRSVDSPRQPGSFEDSAALGLVRNHMARSADVQLKSGEQCAMAVVAAANLAAVTLGQGGRLLFCGNGGSAADCQHIAAEFVSTLSQDFIRPALAAIALTTDTSFLTANANDFGFAGVFARQVEALGRPGDVLFGITTSGNSENVILATQTARSRGLRTVAFTGESGGRLASQVDVCIRVPSTSTQHIQESHIALAHVMCDIIERKLYGRST